MRLACGFCYALVKGDGKVQTHGILAMATKWHMFEQYFLSVTERLYGEKLPALVARAGTISERTEVYCQ